MEPTIAEEQTPLTQGQRPQEEQGGSHVAQDSPRLREVFHRAEFWLSQETQLLAFLYISHFLTRWGSRMWEFAVALFMIEIWPVSLLMTSLYGLMEDLAVFLLGAEVGKWVDRTSRLKVVKFSLATRNFSIVAAALVLVILLVHPTKFFEGDKLRIFLAIVVDVFGGISALAALATNVAVERDWVLVLAEERQLSTLTKLNSVMRGIDLSCKLLAPVAVGLIMSFMSALAAAIFISLWSAISIFFEYYFLSHVYHRTPELHRRGAVLQDNLEQLEMLSGDDGVTSSQALAHEEVTFDAQGDHHIPHGAISMLWRYPNRKAMHVFKHILGLESLKAWKVYAMQEMVLAAVSLAMLYFTVLSFGYLMTASLTWKGIPAYVLGIARGISAFVGLSATIAYPRVHTRLHAIRTGLWSIMFQWMVLALCVASTWLHDNISSAALLMSSVAVSRFGLWMFDLAVLQLLQESVAESERGTVGGVQNSLQSLFELMSFVVGMIISRPKDFPKLVLLSYAGVSCAVLLYTVQVYRVRGHLLHLDCILKLN